ncbi:hypothetical protein BgiMline_027895, partial [Biomphalaria glabrata]
VYKNQLMMARVPSAHVNQTGWGSLNGLVSWQTAWCPSVWTQSENLANVVKFVQT